jgi:hypothetical protein
MDCPKHGYTFSRCSICVDDRIEALEKALKDYQYAHRLLAKGWEDHIGGNRNDYLPDFKLIGEAMKTADETLAALLEEEKDGPIMRQAALLDEGEKE